MTTALAVLHKHRNVLLVDVALLAALFLLPSFSHLTALPLYKLEPMRIALIVALLFTNRANTYLIAFTIPLASAMMTGHPAPFKALLMGIELSLLVATYSYLVRLDRFLPITALMAGILFSKAIYYTMKFAALSLGLLAGSLVSTPLQTQLMLGVGTAVIFGLIEQYRAKNSRSPG